jgi:hypothetical protein
LQGKLIMQHISLIQIQIQILTARVDIILLDILSLKESEILSDPVYISRRVLTYVPPFISENLSVSIIDYKLHFRF